MRALAILAVLVLAPLTDAITQGVPLQPGQRVRVTVPSRDLIKHEESFRQLRADTLVLESMWLPLSDVTRLDAYRGRHRHKWTGVGIGFLGGTVIGYVIAYSTCAPCDDSSVEKEALPVAGAIIGALGGAMIGGMVGERIKTGKWEEVPLDRLRVSIVPQRGGRLGLRVSLQY